MPQNNEPSIDPTDEQDGSQGPGSPPPPPPPPPEPAPIVTLAPEIAQALALKDDMVRRLEARISELERDLAVARDELAAQSRRHELDLALSGAGAIDIETARLLIEAALEQPGAPESPDLRALVAELKSKKPFLFHLPRSRAASRAHPGPMTAALPPAVPDPLTSSASHAARTGDRRSLLSYLRARRGE